jgi:hypothetical protein
MWMGIFEFVLGGGKPRPSVNELMVELSQVKGYEFVE